MRSNGWIYQRANGTDWCAYQAKLAAGVLDTRPITFRGRDGEDRSKLQVLVTAKGLATLAQAMQPGKVRA